MDRRARLAGPDVAQRTLVAPAGLASAEGNTNNFWPWSLYPPAPSIRMVAPSGVWVTSGWNWIP